MSLNLLEVRGGKFYVNGNILFCVCSYECEGKLIYLFFKHAENIVYLSFEFQFYFDPICFVDFTQTPYLPPPPPFNIVLLVHRCTTCCIELQSLVDG